MGRHRRIRRINYAAWAYASVAAVVVLVGTMIAEAEICRGSHSLEPACDLVSDIFYYLCGLVAVVFAAVATASWWRETFGSDV